MMLTALRISEDGQISDVEIPSGDGWETLHAMYREIGCRMVEAVGLGEGLVLWCDEDGRAEGKGLNGCATLIAQHFLAVEGRVLAGDQNVIGTVLLTGGPDEEGDTTGLSVDRRKDVISFLGRAVREIGERRIRFN
jgi:hypothetical protein